MHGVKFFPARHRDFAIWPILFGILLDFFKIRSTCFMFLDGIVWVSSILIYLSEVKRMPVVGEAAG